MHARRDVVLAANMPAIAAAVEEQEPLRRSGI
jgi:hypothetical protein